MFICFFYCSLKYAAEPVYKCLNYFGSVVLSQSRLGWQSALWRFACKSAAGLNPLRTSGSLLNPLDLLGRVCPPDLPSVSLTECFLWESGDLLDLCFQGQNLFWTGSKQSVALRISLQVKVHFIALDRPTCSTATSSRGGNSEAIRKRDTPQKQRRRVQCVYGSEPNSGPQL